TSSTHLRVRVFGVGENVQDMTANPCDMAATKLSPGTKDGHKAPGGSFSARLVPCGQSEKSRAAGSSRAVSAADPAASRRPVHLRSREPLGTFSRAPCLLAEEKLQRFAVGRSADYAGR